MFFILTEIIISGGMSIPQVISTTDVQAVQGAGLGKFSAPRV